MRFSSQSYYTQEFTLKSGETGIIYPCIDYTYHQPFSSRFPRDEGENKNKYYVVFKEGGVYKITESDVEQLVDDEYESEEDFCEKLMVARL